MTSRRSMLVLACLVSSVPCAAISRAEDPMFPVFVAKDSSGSNDRYCGLYCLFQAGRLTHQSLDWNRLIRPERLSGEFGSSLHDLMNCCEEFQIPYRVIPNTTYTDLQFLGGPVIVLVRSSLNVPKPNHWMMVLNPGLDTCEVYDPSYGVLHVSAAELQTLLGGPAIVVLSPGDSTFIVLVWSILKVGIFALVVWANIWVLRTLARRQRPFTAVFASGMLMFGLIHGVNQAGFLHNGRTIDQILSVHFPRQPTVIPESEVIANPDRYILVDARTPQQFEFGRLPGVLNVPITASYWQNEKTLQSIPSSSHVVLYCNSSSCAWADELAKSTLFQRFRAVSTIENGMEGYVISGGRLERGKPSRREQP